MGIPRVLCLTIILILLLDNQNFTIKIELIARVVVLYPFTNGPSVTGGTFVSSFPGGLGGIYNGSNGFDVSGDFSAVASATSMTITYTAEGQFPPSLFPPLPAGTYTTSANIDGLLSTNSKNSVHLDSLMVTTEFGIGLSANGAFPSIVTASVAPTTIPNATAGPKHVLATATSAPFDYPGGSSALLQSMSMTISNLSIGDTVTIDFPNGSEVNGVGPAATPEPATLTLLGMGILGMAGYGWRRRKAAAV